MQKRLPPSLQKMPLFGLTVLIPLVLALLTWQNVLPLAIVSVVAIIITVSTLVFFWKSPGSILILYIIALPVYALSLAILFRLSGSRLLIQVLQPWKELFALFILSTLSLAIIWRLRISKLHWVDKLVLLYFAWNIFYLFVPWGPDFTTRLYGFRANAFFVVLYFIGRFVPLSHRQQKWMLGSIVAVGAAAGLFAIFETVALPLNWPVNIGLMEYMGEFFGVSPRGHFGLTWTFETSTGLRRRSSFFANPLELASSTLITGVAALYLIHRYRRKTWGRWLGIISFGIINISLILAISRASLAAFFTQMLVASIWLRKPRWTFLIIISAVFGMFLILALGGNELVTFIVETVTFQNDSSQGHLDAWIQGITAILNQPQGLGLGRSGHVGSRFNTQVGGENQYVIIGVELGLIGLMLYFLILLSTIRYSLKAYRLTRGITQALTFIAAAAQFGLLFPRFTANIELYIFAMYTSWPLIGFAMKQYVKQQTVGNVRLELSTSQEPNLANSH